MQANNPEDGGIATLLDASRRETSIKKKKKQKKTKKKKKKNNNNKKKNFAGEAPGCSLQIEAGLHLGRGCTCRPAHDASHWLVAK